MLSLASQTGSDRVAPSRYVVQAAHFDVAVASASGAGTNRAVDWVADGLSAGTRNSVLLNCNHAGSRPDPIFYTSMKLLCLDDQLFNLDGGCDLVRTAVAIARRASRMTALLCTDLGTAFTKRREIADAFDCAFDVVVGEPAAVLSLFGLNRIDTLVPTLMQRGTGLVLRRTDFAPIYLRPQSTTVELGEAPISATGFWSEFVPAAFDELLTPAHRPA